MSAFKHKRRQYYINRKFQTSFILKFIGVLVLGAVLSVVVTMLMTGTTLTSSFEGSELVIEKTSLAILPSVIFTSILTTLIIGVIATIVTLFVSHKIAGPMYRFEKDLKEIGIGDLRKTIRIRDGDQFAGVADSLNIMTENLKNSLIEVEQSLDKLKEEAVNQDLPTKFVEDLEDCRNNLTSNFKY